MEEKTLSPIEEALKKLPDKPGVYLMHGAKDEILYVGKAVNLKNRVRQYFQSSRGHTAKIQRMVSQIDHFEYIVTDSEVEALILECNLIKEHRPKYNTMLKDDKSYPYIRVDVQDPFPTITFARRQKKGDKAKYYGPYPSAGAVKDVLELLHKLYQIRTCTRVLPRDQGKERACLNYHIHQCLAPCQGYVSQEEYAKQVREAMLFLEGHYDTVKAQLTKKMQDAAQNLDFERAAIFRDLLDSVGKLEQQQKITNPGDLKDRDVVACAISGQEAVAQVFFIRGGKLIGREHFYMTGVEEEIPQAVLGQFVKQFYAGTPLIPGEIILPLALEEQDLIETWLSERRGQKVVLTVPKQGEKARLVNLARENAELMLEKDAKALKREQERTVGAAEEIAAWLHLPSLHRTESFDVSHVQGFFPVGSMVVFEDGKPKRADYRKFRLEETAGGDDYAGMREMLTRRFSHGMREQEELREKNLETTKGSFNQFPDLILMDGGKGQVHIAQEVLQELGLSIPVCGMVKDDAHRTRGLYYQDVELPIDIHSEGFLLLTRIQDETHRFAIEYHRSLRGKSQVHSVLDDIPGIGKKRRLALLRKFGSVDGIAAASEEELAQTETMDRRIAGTVYAFFHREN